MPYEFCKNPATGEVATMTGFKLRAGWTPCDETGNTGGGSPEAAKPRQKRAAKPKVDVKNLVSGAPLEVQAGGDDEALPPVDDSED